MKIKNIKGFLKNTLLSLLLRRLIILLKYYSDYTFFKVEMEKKEEKFD